MPHRAAHIRTAGPPEGSRQESDLTRFGSQGSDAAGGVGWTDRGQRQAAGSSRNSPGRQSEASDRGRAGGQRGGWVEKAQGPWPLEQQTPFLAGSALSSFLAPTSP